jgi:two-component system LytT family sensor kinase
MMAFKINLRVPKVFKHRFFAHLIAWLLYIGYEASIGLLSKLPAILPQKLIVSFTVNISLFYFCADYLYPVFFDKKRILGFIALMLLALVVYTLIFIGLDLKFTSYLVHTSEDVLTYPYLLARSWRGMRFIGFATVYWITKKLLDVEKNHHMLLKKRFTQEVQEKELQRAIATSELAYTRAQINPHFLFNTLNFLYSDIYPLSGDVAKSVSMLSDMMRFVMGNKGSDGTTELSLEIKHIENYIKLNQLRFHHDLYIDFEYTGTPGNKRIIPFILMTLVENAFKHGDLTDVENPLKIRLDMLSESIRFQISNKINTAGVYEQHGIGMSNVKKCLELFYDNKFKLAIQNDGRYYSCGLEVEL